MDTVRALENQIDQLQRQLQTQRQEAARMRQDLVNENARNLQNFQREMQRDLTRHDSQTRAEYERLLKEYQRSMDREVQDERLRMNGEYQALLNSTRQKEQEWQAKSAELEAMIGKMKADTQAREQIQDREVQSYVAQVNAVYNEVDAKPHEKFAPRRFRVFQNAIQEAGTLFKNGLKEASAAVLISAKSGMTRLGYEVDDKYEEWRHYFTILKGKVDMMRLMLDEAVTGWREETEARGIPDESDKLSARKCLNYWSKGEYATQYTRIAQLGRMIADAEKTGLDAYLKTEESMDLDTLKDYIGELDRMAEEFPHVNARLLERYRAACQRTEWGEQIIDFMTDEINLVWVEGESHYLLASEEERSKDVFREYALIHYGSADVEEDTREWLELVFTNSQDSGIFIYIVPYERNDHVENRIVVYVDYSGPANEEYSRQIYEHVCEAIRLETDDGIINFATDTEQLKTNMNATLRDAGYSIEKKMRRMR